MIAYFLVCMIKGFRLGGTLQVLRQAGSEAIQVLCSSSKLDLDTFLDVFRLVPDDPENQEHERKATVHFIGWLKSVYSK